MMKLVVFSCLLAYAYAAQLGYGAPYAYSTFGYTAPWAYGASYLQPGNYRGPWSLIPGQPAEILGADGRLRDTLDLNLYRSSHITAKVIDSGIHLLKKRDVITPVVAAPVDPIATPLITPATPITYAAPIAPAALSYGPSFTRYL